MIGYALTICRLLLPYYRSSKNVINRWNQRLDKHRLIADVTHVFDRLLLTGLLIEADPSYYTQVLGKNRKAWSINACLSPYNSTAFVSHTRHAQFNKLNGLFFLFLRRDVKSCCWLFSSCAVDGVMKGAMLMPSGDVPRVRARSRPFVAARRTAERLNDFLQGLTLINTPCH